jgi:hypothetical protein
VGDVLDGLGHLVRSVSSSTLSIRTRSAASGVFRSWPMAPSITSFSLIERGDTLLHRIMRLDQAAHVVWPLRHDLVHRVAGFGKFAHPAGKLGQGRAMAQDQRHRPTSTA